MLLLALSVLLHAVPATPATQSDPLIISGRYRISVHADETRFLWRLKVRNPNSIAVQFEPPRRDTERIESVNGRELNSATTVVMSGESELTVVGTLRGTSFTPPYPSTAQYVMLESEPLLRVELVKAWPLVSPGESGLECQFRGCQTIALSRAEALEWNVSTVGTLPAQSVAVEDTTTQFFLNSEGDVIGKSWLRLTNAGAPELVVPLDAKVTALTIDNAFAPLTTTEDGQLRMPLAVGKQEFIIDHRQRLDPRLGILQGTLELPRVDGIVGIAHARFLTSDDWVPLSLTFGATRWLALPAFSMVLLRLVLAAWVWRVLRGVRAPARRSFAVAVLVGLLTGHELLPFIGVVSVLSLATLAFAAPVLSTKLNTNRVLATVVLALVILGLLNLSPLKDRLSVMYGQTADALAGDSVVALRTEKVGLGSRFVGAGVTLGGAPDTNRRELAQAMTDLNRKALVQVVYVSSKLLAALMGFGSLLTLTLIFTLRRAVRDGYAVILGPIFLSPDTAHESPVAAAVEAQPASP